MWSAKVPTREKKANEASRPSSTDGTRKPKRKRVATPEPAERPTTLVLGWSRADAVNNKIDRSSTGRSEKAKESSLQSTSSARLERDDEGDASSSESEPHFNGDSDGDGSGNEMDNELAWAGWSTRNTIWHHRRKGLWAPPLISSRYETEKYHGMLRIRNKWAGGNELSIEEIFGEEFFGEYVPRKIYQSLAALSDRIPLHQARKLVKDTMAARERAGRVLSHVDVYHAHVFLTNERKRIRREAEKEARRVAAEEKRMKGKTLRQKKAVKRAVA